MNTEWSLKWATKRQKIKSVPATTNDFGKDEKMENFELATSSNFNGITCDFYRTSDNYADLWMNRTQIGEALEYKNPNDAIRLIHNRYPERFKGHSTSFKLNGVDGKEREMIVYNRRGIMEICRWSKQPKANEFMDWVWDLVEAYQDGKLKPARQVPSSSTPLDREELAAYMMYNAQIIDTYKSSTDAVLKAVQEKDQALLTQQLNCISTLTEFIKDFCATETARTEKYGSLMASGLYTLKETTRILSESLTHGSAAQTSLTATNDPINTDSWKEQVYSKAEAIGRNLGKPKMKVLQMIYEEMEVNGTDFDSEIASYMAKNHIPQKQVGKINVIADSSNLRAKFDNIIDSFTRPNTENNATPSTLSDSKIPVADTRSLPESVREVLAPLVTKYGKRISVVATSVYSRMEKCGVPLDKYCSEYRQRSGYQRAYKGYIIAQDPKLMKLLKNTVDMMLQED